MTQPFVGTHTAADWSTWNGQNYVVEDDGVTLATAPRRQYVSPRRVVEAPPEPVVDLDVDDCGDVWLLSESGVIRRYDTDRRDLRTINCTWRVPPSTPHAIAVTEHTVYVAAEWAVDSAGTTTGRVHAFDRTLMQIQWVAHDYTAPIALARHRNTVSVLDADAAEPTVSVLGAGGTARDTVTGFGDPIDLAVDSSGDRYVLDTGASGDSPSVERIPQGGTAIETVVPPESFVAADTDATVTPTCLAAGVPGEVVVGDRHATPGTYALFRYRPARSDFERLTSYAGPVDHVHIHRGDEVRTPGLYVVGAGDGALSFLRAAERYRVNPDTGQYDGQVVARLDSGESGMEWHRLTASLATDDPGTQVRLYYHATDDESLQFREPGTGGVQPVTDVHGIGTVTANRLRDAFVDGLAELAQLTPARVAALASEGSYVVTEDRAEQWIREARTILERRGVPGDLDWQSVGPPDPRDALVDDATGRYLWVKAEIAGTPSAAPRIESLRAYFPRQSYLRYMPEVYRRDPRSADFLERFLSLFESAFTDVEESIGASTRYLDADGVPTDALSWLGGWLSLSPDETWSVEDERALLRQAPDLFTARGTRRGLRDLLDIYLDDPTFPPRWEWALDQQTAANRQRVEAGTLSEAEASRLESLPRQKLYIWEYQDLDCIVDPAVRDVYEQVLPCGQCFAVMVWDSIGADRVREVERLVDSTSPAHAIGNVIPLQPSLRLTDADGDTAYNTFLGVNSVLGEREFELGFSGLGAESALADSEGAGELDATDRLGTDTRMS